VLKDRYGGYTVPMAIMTAVNSLAVLFFAVLLRFLPAKAAAASAPPPLHSSRQGSP
jgi:dipeptide/tripeptide permease